MLKPRVLILRAPGANCDAETQFAFEQAGALAERVHINRLRENPGLLHQYQVLVIPGGFTYGDDVAAGKILANQLSVFLGEQLRIFRDKEKLILGICNGFQAILKAGLIMPPDEDGPLATLAHNAHGRFEDRWITLEAAPGKCPFLAGYDRFDVPIAHGEGNFICREAWILKGLEQAGQIVLRYVESEARSAEGGARSAESGAPDSCAPRSALCAPPSTTLPFPINPNGSQGDVAGVCDATGRVLGLMPHPERHVLPTHHPQWTRRGLAEEGQGLRLFRNAVAYFL
ncbi:MAG: phosphoribosylformylglycinamidine synthase subunit PurQ [Gemmataceae bacterium]|nr:phosphoribosylformylglycinamidine synthase subunit PurQ [Gemmataceae bacterium]MCI0743003.1 phosphoribosylformylglycinamidine synthase subunit PurQ [Gemmataceae bacterium]